MFPGASRESEKGVEDMGGGGLKSPQAALAKAFTLVSNLRATLPCKAGKVLTCTDEVADALKEQDATQFPFSVLLAEVEALRGAMRADYDDYDLEVDRRSFAYEMILSLEHRFRLSMELYVANIIFQGVEERYKRIEEALPARSYSLREALSALPAEQIEAAIRQKLQLVLDRYDGQDYKLALREAGEVGETLFALYKQRFKSLGCDQIPRELGPALKHLRKWMSDAGKTDGQGVGIAASGRIEWFLLSMFEVLHYLRNAVSHPSETDDERIPGWQSQRRANFPKTPDCARLALCLTFQIALELSALMTYGRAQDVV
jgi:hypothetical protein